MSAPLPAVTPPHRGNTGWNYVGNVIEGIIGACLMCTGVGFFPGLLLLGDAAADTFTDGQYGLGALFRKFGFNWFSRGSIGSSLTNGLAEPARVSALPPRHA